MLPRVVILAFLLSGAAASRSLGSVVVERLDPGGVAAAAGLRSGDRLVQWSARPGAPGAEASIPGGEIATPFCLEDLEMERAPLGAVTIRLERSGETLELMMPPGEWRLETRPDFNPSRREGFERALGLSEAGEPQAGADALRRLAAAAPDLAERAWLLLRAAQVLGDSGTWDEVPSLCSDAAQQAGAAAEARLLAAVRRNEGDLYLRHDRFSEAFAAFELALAAYGQIGGADLAASEVLLRLGRAHLEPGDLGSAERYLRRALEVRERLAPASLAVAAVLDELGQVLWRRGAAGDLTRAEALLRRALTIQERLAPGGLEAARSHNGIGIVAWLEGRLPEAEKHYLKAAEIRNRLDPDSLEAAATLNNLGGLAHARGDLAGAEAHTRRALEIAERHGPESPSVAKALSNVGQLASRRGDLVAADQYLKRALQIWERLAPGSDAVAKTLNNLGFVAWQRGDLGAAEVYHRRSLAAEQERAPQSLGVAVSLKNLGELVATRDPVAADELLRQALAIEERMAPGSIGLAATVGSLGQRALARGDLEAAEAHFSRSLAIRQRDAPGGLEMADSLSSLAEVAERRGLLGEAQALHERAFSIRERFAPASTEEAESAVALARLHRQAGEPNLAAALYRRAVEALESQHARLGGVEEVRTAFRSQHLDAHRELLALLVEQGRQEEAFAVLERSRARGLLALLAERDLVFAAEIPSDLYRERRRLAAEHDRTLEALGGLSTETDGGEIDRLRATLASLKRQRAEVWEEVRRRAPRLAELERPEPLDLARAHAVLDPGTAVLAYSVAADATHLFVLGPDGLLDVHRLPLVGSQLRADVEAFRSSIDASSADSSLAELRERGERLYRALVEPAETSVAEAERLLLLPDGPLHLLPFAALVRPRPGGGGEFLIEWKPLHVAASLAVYAELKKARDHRYTAPQALLAMGDPRYPGGGETAAADAVLRSLLAERRTLQPLPGTRTEVSAIASLYGDGARVHLGADATEDLLKRSASEARLIHLAAHGIIDEYSPLDSAIVLSVPERIEPGLDNGLLQAWEVFEELRIDADLVTLSACETALGGELAGEGILGLTRAFQFAGARSVLASLWSVADRSTAELMRRFYLHLRQGRPKDEALRAAQLELLHGAASGDGGAASRGVGGVVEAGPATPPAATRSPFYWAAFQLFGDWQ